jgi:trimeric autotransporter adhesin
MPEEYRSVMSSTKQKLRLAGAFATLLILALGVGCTGFFQNPTVSTITVDPPTPSVAIGATQQMTASATYSDGSTGTLSGGTSCSGNTVCWSSSDTSVATISTSGSLTGISQGTATITAASAAITGTTTATVVLNNITSFEVCEGSFGDTTSCSNASTPVTWNADATELVTQDFVAQGSSNGTEYDLTTTAVWTVVNSPTNVTCDNTASPAVCTVQQGTTAGTYPVTITYGTQTATISIVVSN